MLVILIVTQRKILMLDMTKNCLMPACNASYMFVVMIVQNFLPFLRLEAPEFLSWLLLGRIRFLLDLILLGHLY